MLISVFLLLYGVAALCAHPLYLGEMQGPYELDESRNPRSFNTLVHKTSKGALSMARNVFKTFLPSAARIGFAGMRRMVKRHEAEKQQQILEKINKQPGVGLPTTNIAALSPPSTDLNYYNYNYPGFSTASYYGYGGYPYYSSYQQYPYLNNVYSTPYDVSKRMYLPYSFDSNVYYSQLHQQSPYQYQYPAVIATYNAASQENAALKRPIVSTHIPDASTASGISQGLIDLENDVNGFNQAIQYMKEAFISQNADGSSDLQEKIHQENAPDVVGEKKDQIKKKTTKDLFDAFKRTLDSKEKLENKLVNYFTNYVCGDDC